MVARALTFLEFADYQKEGYSILDIRDPASYAMGSVPGSINVELKDDFKELLNLFFVKNQALLIVSEKEVSDEDIKLLKKSGFHNIIGYLKGGIETWRMSGETLDVVISISAEELELEYKHGDLFFIDIRDQAAYDLEHIKGSLNFEPEVLVHNYDRVDDQVTNCIYCTNGDISMSVISHLKFMGKFNLYHINGGFANVRQNTDIKMEATKKEKK